MTIADLTGPGCIKHLWMTTAGGGPTLLREVVLRIFWDDCAEPIVECPLGDFFGMGHALTKNFVSLPLQMSPQQGRAFNSWWSMPFPRNARIEIEYQVHAGAQAPACQLFYHIDGERYDATADLQGMGYFHAQWNRRAIHEGWAWHEFMQEGGRFDQAAFYRRIRQDPRYLNLTGQDNYVMLDAVGDGIYCGAHLDIDCQGTQPKSVVRGGR